MKRRTENTKNQKNQKATNFRNALATGIVGFILGLRLVGCGTQQDAAAELNVAAVEAEVLGDQTTRNLDTSAVAVDVIKEVAGQAQVQTVVETVDRPVYVQGPERVVTNTVVEEKVIEKPVYIEVPGETVVETVEKIVEVEHVYALTNTVDNNNGTYTCTFTCGTCNDSYTVVVGSETEVHVHDFAVVEEKAATCTTDGFTKTACTCGSSDVEVIPATGHNHIVDETTAVAPTYEEEGKEADAICENCGDVIEGKTLPKLEKEETEEEKEEEEHTCEFTVIETIEATCEADGKVVKTCSCGEEEVVTVPATGHDYVEIEGSAVEPTYEENGKTADQECVNCGDIIEGSIIDKLVAEHSHAYVEVERVNPTCCEDGFVKFACECEDSYIETLTAIGHNYIIDETTYVAPTEDSEGKEADEICQNCGDRIEGATIAKLEVVHNSHKDETYCEFNYLKWGFPNAFGGQCTSYEAYLSYLEANYPDCEIVTGTCMVEVAGELCEGTFVYAE